MAIRIAHEPIGAAMLGAYATGVGNAQKKRRTELEQGLQRRTELAMRMQQNQNLLNARREEGIAGREAMMERHKMGLAAARDSEERGAAWDSVMQGVKSGKWDWSATQKSRWAELQGDLSKLEADPTHTPESRADARRAILDEIEGIRMNPEEKLPDPRKLTPGEAWKKGTVMIDPETMEEVEPGSGKIGIPVKIEDGAPDMRNFGTMYKEIMEIRGGGAAKKEAEKADKHRREWVAGRTKELMKEMTGTQGAGDYKPKYTDVGLAKGDAEKQYRMFFGDRSAEPSRSMIGETMGGDGAAAEPSTSAGPRPSGIEGGVATPFGPLPSAGSGYDYSAGGADGLAPVLPDDYDYSRHIEPEPLAPATTDPDDLRRAVVPEASPVSPAETATTQQIQQILPAYEAWQNAKTPAERKAAFNKLPPQLQKEIRDLEIIEGYIPVLSGG